MIRSKEPPTHDTKADTGRKPARASATKAVRPMHKAGVPPARNQPLGNQARIRQLKETASEQAAPPVARNDTGLPDRLKAGVESLSGYSLGGVKVHYNSSKPAKVGALAYTQGSEIHVGPGQEKHLPHEAWHVVQQAQGRVRPTLQLKGVAVNDDAGLEREADVMGVRALRECDWGDKFGKSRPAYCMPDVSNPVQLRPEMKMATGITHLVEMDKGHLYNSNFISNERDQVNHGDSIEIETDVRYRSRRGPNQEEFHRKDENGPRHYLWHLATKLNGKKNPPDYFIRDDTIIESNIGSALVFDQNKYPQADKDDHNELIKQFNNLSGEGGLLMHAVAGGEEVEALGYLIDQGVPLAQIRRGDYRTKLLSYIRSDLSMKTFSFRKFGLLVDWRRIWDRVGYKKSGVTIWSGDQQSSRNALDDQRSYGEAGGTMKSMGLDLHQMALEQNFIKKNQKGSIIAWNEVLMHNAVTAGVVGILWVLEEGVGRESFDNFFTQKKKAELYEKWSEKTGMDVMPIYIYRCMGTRGDKNRLGAQGASSLEFVEKFAPRPKE